MLAFAAEQKTPGAITLRGLFPLSSLYFFPIYQSLSLIIQFYGKSNNFSFVSFEWLNILLSSYLLGCCVNTAIVT